MFRDAFRAACLTQGCGAGDVDHSALLVVQVSRQASVPSSGSHVAQAMRRH